MPPKKKKGREKAETSVFKGFESINQKLNKLLKIYESQCSITGTSVDADLKAKIKSFSEESKLLVRFTLEQPIASVKPPISLLPLVRALRTTWYRGVTDLHFWNLKIGTEDLFTLSTFLKELSYAVEYLELVDCTFEAHLLDRFASCFPLNFTLNTLVLDYTHLGDYGMTRMSSGLKNSHSIVKLSLCYCGLTSTCGEILGELVAKTAVNELYIDGNQLQCIGIIQIVKQISVQAKLDYAERLKEIERLKKASEVTTAVNNGAPGANRTLPSSRKTPSPPLSAKKKKKRKKSGKKKVKIPPKVGPWLSVLHASNNCIDNYDINKTGYVALDVVRAMRSWLLCSEDAKEVDLDDNLIGDFAAREIYQALHHRKEASKYIDWKIFHEERMTKTRVKHVIQGGLKPMVFKTTHRLENELLQLLIQISSSGSKRGKKKKKKGKSGKVRNSIKKPAI